MREHTARGGDRSALSQVVTEISRGRTLLLGIVLLSAIARLATALLLGDQVVSLPGTADQISYHTLALRVLGGHGFSFGRPWWPLTAADASTAHWSYLYTLYLVAVYAIFGPHPLAARLIQALIVGLIDPLLAYRIAGLAFAQGEGQRERAGEPRAALGESRAVPLLAAGLTAVYGYSVYYAATLMTEPFYITAILSVLYLAITLARRLARPEMDSVPAGIRKPAIALGLALAVAVLLRQVFLVFVPFLFLWLGSSYGRRAPRRVLSSVAISACIVALAILPFTVYNYARFGRFVLLNTNAGYAFFWANHPIYGTHFVAILPPDGPSYQDLIPDELRGLDEAALDQALLHRGIHFVVEDPLRYALLSLSRVKDYFKFWPSAASNPISNLVRVLSFGLLLPFMIYGLVLSIVQRPSSVVALLWLFMITYTALHLLSWALIRYRLPVDAVLILFAAFGLVDMKQRLAITSGHRARAMPAIGDEQFP